MKDEVRIVTGSSSGIGYDVEQGYPRKPSPMMALTVLENHAQIATETLMVVTTLSIFRSGEPRGGACLFGQVKLTTPADIQIEHHTQLLMIQTKYCPTDQDAPYPFARCGLT